MHIEEWRHFRNLKLDINSDSEIVCIVGANGSGKSHLLELISACAHRLGLTPGVEIPRGDPFLDDHSLSLQFQFTDEAFAILDSDLALGESARNWDKKLTLVSKRNAGNTTTKILAGENDESVGAQIVKKIAQGTEVYFLSLDANRAYPKKQTRIHEFAEAYEKDWQNKQNRKDRSYRPSYTLYDEWTKYFLAQENQAGTELIRDIRKAREEDKSAPEFMDHFLMYKKSLQSVLPHLRFRGVDTKARTLVFNTTGKNLTFDQLSGGEREIAFLVGQIDRFGLRNGLFLLDEPELHLNADLIRSWVAYLSNTIQSGQVWLATHSLEAVEATGREATYVLERNDATQLVDTAKRLHQEPILSALSRAVGTPAFSISKKVFIFIEGDEGVVEKRRFRSITRCSEEVRFIEGGSCSEVIRRVQTIQRLAAESNNCIRIGGIVDRDWETLRNSTNTSHDEIHVLCVHEIENFFLHPQTIQVILNQNGKTNESATDIILKCADKRIGSWIYQRTMARIKTSDLINNSVFKDRVKQLDWSDLHACKDTFLDEIADECGVSNQTFKNFRKLFGASHKQYEKCRQNGTIWRVCEGKQLLSDVSRQCGFREARDLESACVAVWDNEVVEIPLELDNLRQFIHTL